MHRNCNAPGVAHENETLPPLRVTPKLRRAAELVLGEGESLSAFILDAVARNVEARRAQQAFIARGFASAERARKDRTLCCRRRGFAQAGATIKGGARKTARMKKYRVRFTPDAESDLLRLYDFLLEKDIDAADRALAAIRGAVETISRSPFSCRKAAPATPLLREIVIPFGRSGYVALFEIDDPATVTIVAVRHQREDDYSLGVSARRPSAVRPVRSGSSRWLSDR